MELLRRSGEGRDINRHFYSPAEFDRECARPVVRALMDLIRFRSSHPAFAGDFQLATGADHEIGMEWRNGAHYARLRVDLRQMTGAIERSEDKGDSRFVLATGS